ncbi:cyclic GMP-AMP synthase-like receptor 3 [Glandiceps talaboti]
MAYALAVASKPKSATSIGRGQAVSGHSKSGSLLGSLRNFSSHKVNISQSQQVRAKNVVREKLENLLSNLKENSKGVCSFDYQGSVYEGLKVGAADEFDISVALNGKKDIEPVNVVPGYALMKPIKKDDFRFKKYVTTDGYFSGVQFREKHFFSVVHKWANSMKDDRTNVKISAHGPAVQVDLAPPIGSGLPRKISVDLVPTFRISDGQHYVAKPYKPYAEVPQKLPCDTQLLETVVLEK